MNLITRDELREKLERGDDFKLVMTHTAWAFDTKHIPRSLHLETVGEALAHLDPAEEIVIYSAGLYCAASIYAYHALERRGFAWVRRYAGGIADWEEAGHPLEGGAPEPAAEKRRERRLRRPRSAPAARTPARFARPWYACA
jgi:rhodanese-related sulfurtransferase